MLLSSVFSKALWDARRSLAGWTLAIVAVGAVYAALWPTMSSPEVQRALAAYPDALLEALNSDELTTPEGYLGSSVYGMLLPLLLAVFVVAWGTRVVAGDEEAGTLDLLLAHPVSRQRLALQRMAAVLLGTGAVAVVLWLVMLALAGPAGLTGIGAGDLAAVDLHLALFGALFAALAFAVGAATGSRSVTLGTSAGAVLLSYLAGSVLPQVDGLAWTRDLSPFHWYLGGDPLTNGVQAAGVSTMVAATVVLLVAGTGALTRRDIST